jgi:hypothetical protein
MEETAESGGVISAFHKLSLKASGRPALARRLIGGAYFFCICVV